MSSKESTKIYTRVLDDIGSGLFPSGTRLKVDDLAQRYGTSIIPVREALRLLQGEGIVTIVPNKGATVSDLNADSLRDIFEILQLLEPYFVESFAKSCTEADLVKLEYIQAKLEDTSVEDRSAFTKLDGEFHSLIARKHYNDRAYAIWELQRKTLSILTMNISIARARYLDIIREHRELIEAFRNNDTEAALDIIKLHVRGAGDQMYLQLKAARP